MLLSSFMGWASAGPGPKPYTQRSLDFLLKLKSLKYSRPKTFEINGLSYSKDHSLTSCRIKPRPYFISGLKVCAVLITDCGLLKEKEKMLLGWGEELVFDFTVHKPVSPAAPLGFQFSWALCFHTRCDKHSGSARHLHITKLLSFDCFHQQKY